MQKTNNFEDLLTKYINKKLNKANIQQKSERYPSSKSREHPNKVKIQKKVNPKIKTNKTQKGRPKHLRTRKQKIVEFVSEFLGSVLPVSVLQENKKK